MLFKTYEEELSYKFYEDWTSFWLPKYKKQVFKAKFYNDKAQLIAIKENIMNNWNLDFEMKNYILEQLGIKYLLKNGGKN